MLIFAMVVLPPSSLIPARSVVRPVAATAGCLKALSAVRYSAALSPSGAASPSGVPSPSAALWPSAALLALGGALGLQRGRQPGHLRRQRRERRRRAGQRGLHRPGQLGQQHLARLQVGQLGDLRRAELLAVEHAALDHQQRVGLGEVAQALGGLDHVAADERDRRRPDQQVGELAGDLGLGGRDLGQRVLDHRELGVLSECLAQLTELRDRQAAILGQHGARRRLERLRQLGDCGDFFRVRHGPPFRSGASLGEERRSYRLRRRVHTKGAAHANAPYAGATGRGPAGGARYEPVPWSESRSPARAARDAGLRPPCSAHGDSRRSLALPRIPVLVNGNVPLATGGQRDIRSRCGAGGPVPGGARPRPSPSRRPGRG